MTIPAHRKPSPLAFSVLIPAIMEFDGTGGLRALLARYRGRTADVAVEDPGILLDVDTHDDYEGAQKALTGDGGALAYREKT